MSYYVLGANFNGIDNRIYKTTAFASVTDSVLGTISFWVRLGLNDYTDRIILGSYNATVKFYRDTSNYFHFILDYAAGGQYEFRSTNQYVNSGQWVHVLASWNLTSGSAVCRLYINDKSDVEYLSVGAGIVDYTPSTGSPRWFIGYDANTANRYFTGCLAEIWFAPGVYFNLSQVSERRKFITSPLSGVYIPANLGLNGELPSGTSPALYLSLRPGDAVTVFGQNRGTGGAMSIGGTLTVCMTSPSAQTIRQANKQPFDIGIFPINQSDHSFGVEVSSQRKLPFGVQVESAIGHLWTSPLIRASRQSFGILVENSCHQLWPDRLSKANKNPWGYSFQTSSRQLFAINETLNKTVRHEFVYSLPVVIQHIQPWPSLERNPVQQNWKLLWGCAAPTVQISSNSVRLYTENQEFPIIGAAISQSEGEGVWSGECELADPADFRLLQKDHTLFLEIGTSLFTLMVNEKTLSREGLSPAKTKINLISPAAILDAPRAKPIVEYTLEESTLAAEVARMLSADIPGSWHMVDWLVRANRLTIERDYPLPMIKRIAAVAGGVVESTPEGQLSIRPRFPVSVPDWESVSVDHVITDEYDNLSIQEKSELKEPVNLITVRDYIPTKGYLSAEVDARPDGLNAGITEFYQNSTARFLVHTGPWVTITELTASDGLGKFNATQTWTDKQDLVFDKTDQAKLSKPVLAVDEVKWLGNDLGSLSLQDDHQTVIAEFPGVAIARVQVRYLAQGYDLAAPQDFRDEKEYPVQVRIDAEEIKTAEGASLTLQRGAGDYPGEDIHEPLLSAPAIQARAMAELDAGELLQSVSLTVLFRPDLILGQLIEVQDACQGQTWRGKIVNINHQVAGPVVTTALEVLRAGLSV